MRDVVHEGRVRADDEDAPQLLAMRVEEPRRAVEADGRLARARAALDDQRALGRGGDQAVLIGLDRGDDVAHPHVAAAVELLEKEVGDPAPSTALPSSDSSEMSRRRRLRAEAAALRDAVRILRRRRVERPRGGRLPVDDERLVLVVRDPAAADVQRPRRRRRGSRPKTRPRSASSNVCMRRFAHASMLSAAHSVAIASCVRATVDRMRSSWS